MIFSWYASLSCEIDSSPSLPVVSGLISNDDQRALLLSLSFEFVFVAFCDLARRLLGCDESYVMYLRPSSLQSQGQSTTTKSRPDDGSRGACHCRHKQLGLQSPLMPIEVER